MRVVRGLPPVIALMKNGVSKVNPAIFVWRETSSTAISDRG